MEQKHSGFHVYKNNTPLLLSFEVDFCAKIFIKIHLSTTIFDVMLVFRTTISLNLK